MKSGNTLFVSSRILDDLLNYYRKHKDDKVQFDMNRFIHDKEYGYHFRNEAEKDGLEESIEMLNTN